MRRLFLLVVFLPALALAQPRPPSGGIKISGSPAANQVTLWATGSSVKGDSNLAWDPTNKTLTILGTAGSANALVIPFQSQIASSSGTFSYSASAHWNMNSTLDVFGSISSTSSSGTINTSGYTNNITMAGATTTNPVTVTASGSDGTVGINLVPKSTGAVFNNADPIPAVHRTQSTAQQSIEFGSGAGTAGALSVTFATAFTASPICIATVENATGIGCAITSKSGSAVAFSCVASGTDVIDWICMGAR